MSLFDSLFGGLFGDEETSEETIEYPCSNCPSSCALAPDACSICQPYKEKMIDAIYRVEHKDEIISQYEVVGTSAQEGSVVCPHCGGHSDNHYICDYCGSKLQDGTGKIQVASAADIPNPVLEAQDIIFDRQAAVREYTKSLSSEESGGFLSSIFGSLFGMDTTEETVSVGRKMTESEIKEMADYFDVSVSDYLTGLDNGKYPTLSNKESYLEAEKTYAETTSASDSSSAGMLSGLAGLAGALGLGSAILGGTQSVNTGSYNSSYMGSGMGGFNLFGTGSNLYGTTSHPTSQTVRPETVKPANHPYGQSIPRPENRPQNQHGPRPGYQSRPEEAKHNVQASKPSSKKNQSEIKTAHKVSSSQKATMKAEPKTAASEKRKLSEAEYMAKKMGQSMQNAPKPKKTDSGKLAQASHSRQGGSGGPKPGGRH